MTIKIQRGRQFAANDAAATVFDRRGQAGEYLSKAADKLVSQQLSLVLRDGRKKLTLASAVDWQAFLGKYCSTKEQTEGFSKEFGITFGDFLNALDDAAASDDRGLTLDLRPTSAVSQALCLDQVDGDYGVKLAKDATVALTGANGATGTLQAVGVPTIGADILATPITADWERDRTEMEAWGDFKLGDGAGGKFKENTGPAPYAKLHDPRWNDPEAMALVNDFALPLHLEVKGNNPDGTTKFQDGYEMFRDTYYEGQHGELEKSGASLRARVRFDNNPPFNVNRVLVQAKEGRSVQGSDSAVHKFEKRWEGNFTDENAAKDILVSGREKGGSPLVVTQKLYKLAQDKGALAPDGNLQLEAKYLVLQKRRRTHLQLDSVSDVQQRRSILQTDMDSLAHSHQPIPAEMSAYAKKLDEQVKFLTDASALLRKYGQYMPSGECFIISADRYNVYDAGARAGSPPTDIDDETARIGRGPLHIEAEWDSASSDPFEKAAATLGKRLAANPDPATKATLEADRDALEGMRATFRKDVAQTVEVIKRRLSAAGLEEEQGKLSKEERAAALAKDPKRPVFWK